MQRKDGEMRVVAWFHDDTNGWPPAKFFVSFEAHVKELVKEVTAASKVE